MSAGTLEAASIPAHPLESAQSFTDSFTNRLALGIAAGLIAVLIHGEAPRLATEELTWRALLGR
jgi:hypothetical protein